MGSRTMKPEEAIRALAFMCDVEELTITQLSSLPEEVRDDSFGGGVRGTFSRSLTKLLSERSLDLYSTKAQGNFSSSNFSNSNFSNSLRNSLRNHPIPESSLSKNNLHLPGTSSTATPDSDEKGVSFGIVEVRKYPITIGMNPSVSRGVPRTIEWDHLEDETERHHINAYERDHPTEERKHGEELLLDGITRAKMLRDVGFSKKELLEGIRRAREHKYQKNNQYNNSKGTKTETTSGSGSSSRRRRRDLVSMRMGSKR